MRHALELRHASWFVPQVAARLRAANVAVCMADAPDFPMWREVTADFVYARLHGHTRKYASSYSGGSLRRWAADALRWQAEGRDVFLYFDNDVAGCAVVNARAFAQLVTAGRGRDRCRSRASRPSACPPASPRAPRSARASRHR